MPKPKKGPRLGGGAAHQRLILSNLATQLFEHRRIITTETKARTLRPYAEKLITKAKKAHLGENPLHQRREVLKVIHDKGVVHELFTTIAPLYAERPGGYTRITKLAPRQGDNAPMAVIELVTDAYTPAPASEKPAPAPVESTTETDEVEATETEATETDESTESAPAGLADIEYGEDVAAPLEDGSAPEGFEIKGNKDSGKYHTPASQWYDQTVAEVWFRTEEAAEAAGFVKAG